MSKEPSQQDTDLEVQEGQKYLIFSLAGEMYGTPLTDLNEVIEAQEPKPMPNMVEHFKGVINLRGQIVGIINLAERLGIPKDSHLESRAAMIFENDSGIFAISIDRIVSILELKEEQIDRQPTISTKVPIAYLSGVAKTEDQLITLIAVNSLLSEEMLLSYRRSKFAG